MTSQKRVYILSWVLVAAVILAGCSAIESISNVGASIGHSTGLLSGRAASAVRKSGKALDKAAKEITPEQEYYIGRSVGANILAKYRPYNNPQANMYINHIGQTLAAASDRPETFCGYHFLILDSDDVNAIAAPAGLIFVTRGLLRCCKNEDEVASVLAHEVGHAQNKDAMRAIKTARLTTALTIMGTEAAKAYGPQELAALTESFDDSIQDIVHKVVDSGYSRKVEYQADAAAIDLLGRIGYDPNALLGMLSQMDSQMQPGGVDFAKTHPQPSQRISKAIEAIGPGSPAGDTRARQARFQKALAGI